MNDTREETPYLFRLANASDRPPIAASLVISSALCCAVDQFGHRHGAP